MAVIAGEIADVADVDLQRRDPRGGLEVMVEPGAETGAVQDGKRDGAQGGFGVQCSVFSVQGWLMADGFLLSNTHPRHSARWIR